MWISISCQLTVSGSWMLFKKQPGVSKSYWHGHVTDFGPNWRSVWKEQSCYFGFGFETDHKCSCPKPAGFYLTALSNRNTSAYSSAKKPDWNHTVFKTLHRDKRTNSQKKGERWRDLAMGKATSKRAHAWSAETCSPSEAFVEWHSSEPYLA